MRKKDDYLMESKEQFHVGVAEVYSNKGKKDIYITLERSEKVKPECSFIVPTNVDAFVLLGPYISQRVLLYTNTENTKCKETN